MPQQGVSSAGLPPPEHVAGEDGELVCPSCLHLGEVIGTSFAADVIRCPACALCFLRRSVRANSANDNNWYQDLVKSSPALVRRFLDDMGDAYRAQLRELADMTAGRTLVDVGCGVGVFLAVAKAEGWKIHGVDESPHAHAFAREHFSLEFSASLADVEPGEMDVVRISHVLEHVPDPRPFLEQLNKLLTPGGVLAVVVPNREPLGAAIVNRLRGLRSRRPRLSGSIYPDMHVLGFSEQSLDALLRSTGFTPLRSRTVSMGNTSYYPMFFDGLLTVKRPGEIEPRQLLRYWLPSLLDNLGNAFGRGRWIVAHFVKSS